jgi:hypothetical protein
MVKKMSESLNDKKNECFYECSICDFKCSYKSNYDAHLSTQKHKTKVKNEETSYQPPDNTIIPCGEKMSNNICKYCNKQYAHLSALSRHKKVCSKIPTNNQQPHSMVTRDEFDKLVVLIQEMKNNSNNTQSNTSSENIKLSVSDFQNTLVHTTNCMKDMLLMMMSNSQLQNKMIEISSQNSEGSHSSLYTHIPSGVEVNSVHNTFNNTTTTSTNNSNNNTFNMNMFLNEKCKDAMNMKDFVNSIQLNITDLENVGRLGYVEGMSNIFIDNLQKTDLYKRPVHCSDVKRETLYVKDNNQWQRDGPDHAKMTNAVLAVEQKNVALVSEWAKANPRCMNSNTRENETYFKLSKADTDGEKDGNIAKVIRKVAKRVTIEKDQKYIEDM